MTAQNINKARDITYTVSNNIGFNFDETVKEKNAEDFSDYYEEEFEKGVKPEKIIKSFFGQLFF